MKTFYFFILLTVIFIFSCSNSSNSLDELSYDNVSEISKIVIESSKDKIELKKNNSSWIVNNDFTAIDETINECLQVISGMKINSTVSKNDIDSVTNLLNKRITIYDATDTKLKSWQLGSFDKYAKATNIKIENEDRPYLANLPGLIFDLNVVFSDNEVYWITKNVFKHKFYEISKIKIEYSDSLKKSYEINAQTKEIIDIKSGKNNFADSTNVVRYLSYFADVEFSKLLSFSKNSNDSILNSTYICKVTITDKDKKQTIVAIYPKFQKSSNNKDMHNAIAYLFNKKQFVQIRYFDIDLIMKKFSYFLKSKDVEI